ncbi:major facilitator superfamily domain-containing protein [Amylostereum chailletii]|nr:major facilitator superfamily domain-containing protein [Amylostereum chailletii]
MSEKTQYFNKELHVGDNAATATESSKDISDDSDVQRDRDVARITQVDSLVWDGGFQAWSTLLGAYVNSFGVYEVSEPTLVVGYQACAFLYARVLSFTLSIADKSWIGGVQMFCLFSIGIFSGFAMDMGYFRHIMLLGSVMFVFCLFMISLSQPQQWYQLFLAQGIGLGLAIGAMYIPALGVVAHHFKRRRSLAMGIIASASSLSGVVHPIMLNNLIHGNTGFRWAVRYSAFMNLGLLAIANLIMRPRLPPRPSSLRHQLTIWRHFLSSPTFVWGTVGTFFLILGMFFPTFYLQLASVVKGVNPSLAFYSLSILNASSAFGRVVPNIAVDRVGVFTLIVPSTLACGVIILSLAGLVNAAGTIVIAILFGFFSGACISLLGPMLAGMSRDASEIGPSIRPPITGVLLTSHNVWIRPILFNGIAMCVGAAGLAYAGFLSKKRG